MNEGYDGLFRYEDDGDEIKPDRVGSGPMMDMQYEALDVLGKIKVSSEIPSQFCMARDSECRKGSSLTLDILTVINHIKRCSSMEDVATCLYLMHDMGCYVGWVPTVSTMLDDVGQGRPVFQMCFEVKPGRLSRDKVSSRYIRPSLVRGLYKVFEGPERNVSDMEMDMLESMMISLNKLRPVSDVFKQELIDVRDRRHGHTGSDMSKFVSPGSHGSTMFALLRYYARLCESYVAKKCVIDEVITNNILYFKHFEEFVRVSLEKNVESLRQWLLFSLYVHVAPWYMDSRVVYYDYLDSTMDVVYDYGREKIRLCGKVYWKDASNLYNAYMVRHRHIRQNRANIVECVENVRSASMEVVRGQKNPLTPYFVDKLKRVKIVYGFDQVFVTDQSTYANLLKQFENDKSRLKTLPWMNLRYMDEYMKVGYHDMFVDVLKKVGKDVDREEWLLTRGVFEANAYYCRELNVVYLPSILFQQPFFEVRKSVSAPVHGFQFGKKPEVLNKWTLTSLVGVGFIVAHELAHALDNQSREWLYDHGGLMRNRSSQVDLVGTFRRLRDNDKKIVHAYSNRASVSELKEGQNGKVCSLSEDWSDIMALKVIYYIFSEGGVRKPSYPQLYEFFSSYTSKRFLNFRRAVLDSNRHDPHSDPSKRVDIPLNMLPEYRRYLDPSWRDDPSNPLVSILL